MKKKELENTEQILTTASLIGDLSLGLFGTTRRMEAKEAPESWRNGLTKLRDEVMRQDPAESLGSSAILYENREGWFVDKATYKKSILLLNKD